MAINPIDVPCDKAVTLSHSSINHYRHGISAMDYYSEGSISSLTKKYGKHKNNLEPKSPYLKNTNHPILDDSVQLLSRVTEKRLVHKNGGNMLMSSFPLAGDIYKANSDDFKSKQTNKKILKSVLTLPNNSAPAPQLCIVSDMNDSEYSNEKDDHRRMTKRYTQAHKMRKSRPYYNHELESQYCSEMDFNLDSSSTDTIKKCGDGKRMHKSTAGSKGKLKEKLKPHDVWAVLRNMNRFQFQTSPQISENNFIMSKQRTSPKLRNNRKDTRVFETRCTEEFAYISSYNVVKSPTLSLCSSFGKITVIDKNLDSKVSKEIEDKPKKKKTGKLLGPRAIKNSIKNKTLPAKQNDFKSITYTNPKKKYNIENTSKWQAASFVISPNNEDPKETVNKNESVDLGYESKTTENEEDFASFDKNTTTQASQSSQSKLSDNSGSSKAAVFPNRLIHKKAKPKARVEPSNPINGITKVILSSCPNTQQLQQEKKIEPLKLKSNITKAAEKPTCNFSPPKLTKTELNRQLHKYRFPIVILGKDQLRSSMHVVNSENVQFDGLDQSMWPFMQSWYGNDKPVEVPKKRLIHNVHNKKTKLEEVEKKAMSKNSVSRSNRISDKIPKTESKRAPLPLSEIIKQTTQNQRKLKPIIQLKDRVIKLLYKNSSVLSMIGGSPDSDTAKNDSSTMTEVCIDYQDKSNSNNTTAKRSKCALSASKEKRSWAKGKRASDFIENVIKKIKSGAYYSQNGIENVCNETFDVETKEEGIQTDSISDDVIFNINNEEPQKLAIPGFDSVLPALEIKTMSLNEVAVKHCGTNIVVHFDVTVPTSSIVAAKDDSYVIPLNINKSLTKVFKCQTSILNAMLPAELCSILPNMVRDIVDSGQHLALYTAPIDITCLTTISEIPMRSESGTNMFIPKLTLPTIIPILPIPSKLQQLLSGGYYEKDVKTIPSFHILRNTACSVNYEEMRLAEEMRRYIKRIHQFDIENQLMMSVKLARSEETKVLPIITTTKVIEQKNSTALQPYTVTNHRQDSMTRTCRLMDLFETMATYINNIGLPHSRIETDNTSVNFNISRSLATNVISLRIDNLKIDPLENCFKYSLSSNICILPDTNKALVASSRPIEIVELSDSNEKILYSNNCLNNKKVRRKTYDRLFRKCRSSNNISAEKVTPLSRIANLDDFFEGLGSAKLLSSVFDGQSGNKIMSSIKELKNWTTDISPKQALLVILLANKKDFPNLLRYRPLLLQGIAVKRITKAIELDMEIEVIEKENLHGVSRYEGISYVPASIENQSSLYEELCWIAKNTASDYQKPFDHNSEKLLKCLLSKRSQLNPSYLRVMARYVGLGLLKSPGKMH